MVVVAASVCVCVLMEVSIAIEHDQSNEAMSFTISFRMLSFLLCVVVATFVVLRSS